MTRCQQDLEIIYSSKQEQKKHLCGDSQGIICDPRALYEDVRRVYACICAEMCRIRPAILLDTDHITRVWPHLKTFIQPLPSLHGLLNSLTLHTLKTEHSLTLVPSSHGYRSNIIQQPLRPPVQPVQRDRSAQ